MGVYSMLTDTGLNEITNAQSDVGILIEVNHWVASFDQDLEDDFNATGNTNWKDVSHYTTPTDTHPTGTPIYWKNSPNNINLPEPGDIWTGVNYSSVVNFDVSPDNKQGDWKASDPYPSGPVKADWWNVT